MLKNYFKITFRNIFRNKGYTAVNILGLAVGMASCVLILFYAQYELSFDDIYNKKDSIYRLILERKGPKGLLTDAVTPAPLAPALMNDFPGIKTSVRFAKVDNPVPLVSSDDKRFYEKQLFFVDPGVFELFTIPFVSGSFTTALQEPNSVVIGEETSKKYFGTDYPIGKTLQLNNYINLHVTGVIKNFPSNSTINADFLISFSTLYGWLGKDFVDNWQNNMCLTYVLFGEHTSTSELTKGLPGFINKYVDKSNPMRNIYLQPLSRIHLYSHEDYNINSDGDIHYVRILTAIAIFILLIACFNYVGLTIARSIKRFKETGIRKLFGATRKQLVYQYVSESLFYMIIALSIALLIVIFSLPELSDIIGKNFSIDTLEYVEMISIPAVLVLIVGLLSGSYPAFFLSSLQPVNVIKAQIKNVSGKVSLWKVLVVIQFTLTILLIIGSWVVYNQLNYMRNKKLGFDGNQVIVVPIRDEGMRQNQSAVKARLYQFPGIQRIGAAALLPGGPVGRTRYRIEGNSEIGTMSMLWVDYDFVKTLGLQIYSGRDFSKEFSSDSAKGFIINEIAAKQLGFLNPADAVGKSFELIGSKKGNIIGVVKDFHFTSLQNKIEPIVMHIWPWLNYLLVRTEGKDIPALINNLKSVWNEFDPKNPFEFSLLSDNFDQFYLEDQKLEKVSTGFTLIALLIACVGLFSLSAYIVERRTREIGIHKVFGASISGIFGAQLKEFLILVVIAMLIAFPAGYFIMSEWLQNYAYRFEINISTFLLAGLISLITAIFAVCYHVVKAALTNPVDSLMYE